MYRTVSHWLLIALVAAVSACDQSEGDEPNPGTEPGTGGSPTGAGGTGTATATATATGGAATGGQMTLTEGCGLGSVCAAGHFCSSALACIPDGTCLADDDCGDGKVCDGATESPELSVGACVAGGECGASEFDLTTVAPNLLIVLDRSCSMNAEKWEPAVDSLVTITTELGSDIRFGLEVFPDGLGDSSCEQNPTGETIVPIGPDGGPEISALLQAARDDVQHPIYPSQGPCGTNTWASLDQASRQAELADPERASYVILITDGEAACLDSDRPGNGDDAMINDVIADLASRGVPTFVVGFGDEIGTDSEALTRYAESGGTTPADRPYYDAADGAELLTAFEAIGKTIVACDYALDSAPPEDDLYVFFDDTDQIPRDPTHTEGWDFDTNTLVLTFYGTACERLQGSVVTDIDVVFGCAEPVLH